MSNAQVINIKAPDFRTITFRIKGTAPYMQNKFSAKAIETMIETQEAGTQAKSKKVREAKDFKAACHYAAHISTEGWYGIPASAFRSAAIDACRMVGFKMTHARMSIFIMADGFDATEGTPLVRLAAGEYEMSLLPVRLPSGPTDIHPRPMWREWGAEITARYDSGQFSAEDVMNLFMRAGIQCGVGEGRPFSRSSNGLGFGTWEIETK